MPRLASSLPKYRKHRASGQAVVTLSGRDHYLGPHGTAVSKREYDRLAAEWLIAGRAPAAEVGPGLTLVEVLAAYLRFAKEYFGGGARGEFANLKRALRPLRDLYGRSVAAEFGPRSFQAVRQQLVQSGLSRTYVNATMLKVKRLFRWAASEGLIPVTVPQTLAMIPGLRRGRSGARETAPVRPADPQAVEKTLPLLPRVVAAMVRVQGLTGARPGEVCALRLRDLDRSGPVWEARLLEHKTAHHGRERTIYFGPQAQEVLAPLQDPPELRQPPRDQAAAPPGAAPARPLHDPELRPGDLPRVRQGGCPPVVPQPTPAPGGDAGPQGV